MSYARNSTTLSALMTTAATTASVGAALGIPTGAVAQIGAEIVYVGGGFNSVSWSSITRGINGTSAVLHATGAGCTYMPTYTTLTNGVTAGATTLNVNTTIMFPSTGYFYVGAAIGNITPFSQPSVNELMLCTATGATSLTVIRGVNGTTPQPMSTGANIYTDVSAMGAGYIAAGSPTEVDGTAQITNAGLSLDRVPEGQSVFAGTGAYSYTGSMNGDQSLPGGISRPLPWWEFDLVLPESAAGLTSTIMTQLAATTTYAGGAIPAYLSAMGSILTIDVSGKISGICYVNGVPQKGVKVKLYWKDSGRLISAIYTDANGAYSFPNLRKSIAYYEVVADSPSTSYNSMLYDLVLAV